MQNRVLALWFPAEGYILACRLVPSHGVLTWHPARGGGEKANSLVSILVVALILHQESPSCALV